MSSLFVFVLWAAAVVILLPLLILAAYIMVTGAYAVALFVSYYIEERDHRCRYSALRSPLHSFLAGTEPPPSPRWALIAVAVPLILLFTRPQRHLTAAHAFGLAVIGWAAVSLTWTANVYDGLDQLLQYLFLAGVFVLGARTADLKPVMTGFAWGIAVSSVSGDHPISGALGLDRLAARLCPLGLVHQRELSRRTRGIVFGRSGGLSAVVFDPAAAALSRLY